MTINIPQINEQIKKVVLKNGLTVYLYENPEYSEYYAQYNVKYGSTNTTYIVNGTKYEDPKGIAHYLEHLMFAGVDFDYFEKFNANGADANAFTSYDTTAYTFSCADNFEQNLQLLIEMVQTINISEKTVNKERNIIEQEIKMYEQKVNFKLYYSMMKNILKASEYRHDIAGTVETINEITSEMIIRCFETFYQPANQYLILAGPKLDIDLDNLQILDGSIANTVEKIEFEEPFAINEQDVAIEISENEVEQIYYGIKLQPLSENYAQSLIMMELFTQFVSSEINQTFNDYLEQHKINNSLYCFSFMTPKINLILMNMQLEATSDIKGYWQNVQKMSGNEMELLIRNKIGKSIAKFNTPRQIVKLIDELVGEKIKIDEYFQILYNLDSEEMVDKLQQTLQNQLNLAVYSKKMI